MTDALHSVLGSGVFNTNGDLWRFHRNMSRPFFTKERLRGMVPVFVSHADKALEKLEVDNNGGPVDIQDLASKFTLDAATQFLFGNCVNSLDEDLPRPWSAQPSSSSSSPSTEEKKHTRDFSTSSEPLLPTSNTSNTVPPPPPRTPTPPPKSPTEAFPSAFTSALSTLATRLRSGALWPLFEITRDSTRRDVGVIRGFVRGIVQAALERREEREREGVEEKVDCAAQGTLLDHLVTVSDGEFG